jgi:hypothetical protein
MADARWQMADGRWQMADRGSADHLPSAIGYLTSAGIITGVLVKLGPTISDGWAVDEGYSDPEAPATVGPGDEGEPAVPSRRSEVGWAIDRRVAPWP